VRILALAVSFPRAPRPWLSTLHPVGRASLTIPKFDSLWLAALRSPTLPRGRLSARP